MIDPDVVMVGEIRDELTADVAVEASLTGHKVLSTIHTNDAVGSIPRFLEMGVKGYALADSLTLVIGQRLVRRVCPKCKAPVNIDDAEKNLVIDILSNLPDNHGIKLPNELTFYSGAGCDRSLWCLTDDSEMLLSLFSFDIIVIIFIYIIKYHFLILSMLWPNFLQKLDKKCKFMKVYV